MIFINTNKAVNVTRDFIISDMCDSIECQNSGTCKEGECLCADGFSGELCETGTSPFIELLKHIIKHFKLVLQLWF